MKISSGPVESSLGTFRHALATQSDSARKEPVEFEVDFPGQLERGTRRTSSSASAGAKLVKSIFNRVVGVRRVSPAASSRRAGRRGGRSCGSRAMGRSVRASGLTLTPESRPSLMCQRSRASTAAASRLRPPAQIQAAAEHRKECCSVRRTRSSGESQERTRIRKTARGSRRSRANTANGPVVRSLSSKMENPFHFGRCAG